MDGWVDGNWSQEGPCMWETTGSYDIVKIILLHFSFVFCCLLFFLLLFGVSCCYSQFHIYSKYSKHDFTVMTNSEIRSTFFRMRCHTLTASYSFAPTESVHLGRLTVPPPTGQRRQSHSRRTSIGSSLLPKKKTSINESYFLCFVFCRCLMLTRTPIKRRDLTANY